MNILSLTQTFTFIYDDMDLKPAKQFTYPIDNQFSGLMGAGFKRSFEGAWWSCFVWTICSGFTMISNVFYLIYAVVVIFKIKNIIATIAYKMITHNNAIQIIYIKLQQITDRTKSLRSFWRYFDIIVSIWFFIDWVLSIINN